MKYIKTYEDTDEFPQIGDYILMKMTRVSDFNLYVSTHIGKIVDRRKNHPHMYVVKYDEVIPHWNTNLIDVFLNEILYFSKNKEELELKLQINKFNI